MIVDCHAHVIQNWIGACGHPTRDLHMKYLQRVIAGTVARTYRARDGAPADTKALIRAEDQGWSGLRDVDFRVGRFGQLEFTVDGEDYYTQYMPVGMQNLEAPPELMLAQMTYTGVDHAVLQAGGAYGAMTEYNAFAQLQYPQKFTALMHLDEAMAGTPEALAQIDRAAALGVKGLYYNFEGFARHNFPWDMDDTRLDAVLGSAAGAWHGAVRRDHRCAALRQAQLPAQHGRPGPGTGSVRGPLLPSGDGHSGAVLRRRRSLGLAGRI